MAFDPSSLFGIDCVRCGNELIAPENTEYVDVSLFDTLGKDAACISKQSQPEPSNQMSLTLLNCQTKVRNVLTTYRPIS